MTKNNPDHRYDIPRDYSFVQGPHEIRQTLLELDVATQSDYPWPVGRSAAVILDMLHDPDPRFGIAPDVNQQERKPQ